MKIYPVILIGILLFGCSNHESLKPGKYAYVTFSKVQLAYLYLTQGVDRYFTGSEIILNVDSTFTYTTCSKIITGKWDYRNDSLFLRITKNRWRIDSLDKYGFNGTWPAIPPKPVKFKYDNGFLIQIHTLKSGEKIIEKLKFNVP